MRDSTANRFARLGLLMAVLTALPRQGERTACTEGGDIP